MAKNHQTGRRFGVFSVDFQKNTHILISFLSHTKINSILWRSLKKV